jgi:uncharacterized protein
VADVLVDAGPLVAIIDRADPAHDACVEALSTLNGPLLTVWPAFTEAMYLLGGSWLGQKALWSRLEIGALGLAPLDETDAPRMRELMEKHRDLPMDLTDAALVRVASATHSPTSSPWITVISRSTGRDDGGVSRSCRAHQAPCRRRRR